MIRDEIKEIIDSKSILKSLVVKNLIGHYRNSILGFSWNFIIPIMMMIIYYVVFTEIRQNAMPDFWIFISSAIFPFSFMVSNLTNGCGCIISNGSLIKKVYFPRAIVVLAQVISSFIILLIGLSLVIVAIIITGYPINFSIGMLPIIILLMLAFTIGYTLALSAITVYVRDIQYFLSSMSVAFFFVTPMYFMAEEATGLLQTIIWLNPFTYFIEPIHQIVYSGSMPNAIIVVVCVILSIASMTLGCIIFKKLEKGFVERL